MANKDKNKQELDPDTTYKAHRKQKKAEEKEATKDALKAGAKIAGDYLAPGVGGKVVDVATKVPGVDKALGAASKVVNKVPGVGKVTKKLKDSGATDLANKLGSIKSKSGANLTQNIQNAATSAGKKAAENVAQEKATEEATKKKGKSSTKKTDGSSDSGQEQEFKLFGKGSFDPIKMLPIFGGPFLLLLLVVVIAVTAVGGSNASALSPIAAVTDENYEASSEEEQAYIDRIDEVASAYTNSNARLSIAQLSAAVVVMRYSYDQEFSYEDMTKEEIQELANLLEQYDFQVTDSNHDDVVNSLIEYYKGKIPDQSDEYYSFISEETLNYIENYNEAISSEEDQNKNYNSIENNLYWWPVGSSETTVENGVEFASGDPASVAISSQFQPNRVNPVNGNSEAHRGVDLLGGTTEAGVVNVIAAKDGVVVKPSALGLDTCQSFGNVNCGSGFGNYITIQHSDGNYTVYAHLHQGTILVKAGDTVKQGQVIAKMGSSGQSTGTHLHFEIREGADLGTAAVDPLNYIDPDNPRPMSSGGWSLTSTSLSRAEFIAKMENYCNTNGNTAFCNNFSAHAGEIYDISLDNNVNPELVVVTAGTEQGWRSTCGYNYWGIGIANGQGCSSGAQYSSFEEGIRGFAATLQDYLPGGSHDAAITNRYNEREAAGCDPAGHGLPGTLEGWQSVYSWVGTYREFPGSSGSGGCYALNLVYGAGYCDDKSVCTASFCPESSRTTVCEQNDYTAWQLNQKREFRYNIFGL